jgi:hypothetical protein
MKSILHALAEAHKQTELDTVTAGPFVYQIRRVTSSELVASGFARLFAARAADPARPPPSERDQHTFAESMVAAGVVAISADGGATYDPCTIVTDPKREDVDAGRLWIDRLLQGHPMLIAAAVLKHSTDGGRAAELVSSFLGAAAPDAASRGQ